ncbi:MAG TPA: hypothetical protein VMT54_19820 [Candidatus Cybelea sp.]|nr:hypothetical protein [Candidatus Cybelea sp.]
MQVTLSRIGLFKIRRRALPNALQAGDTIFNEKEAYAAEVALGDAGGSIQGLVSTQPTE